MNHYPAFLRSYNGKSTSSTSNSSSSNSENDENSSIKSLIFKHLSKVQQGSSNNNHNNNTKGTMRGILGEVGNMTLSNIQMTSIITKPKTLQQQSVTTIVEATSTITAPPPAPPPQPPSTSIIPIVVNKIEKVTLDDDQENNEYMPHEPIAKLTKVPSEFDCDSGDSYNITTVSEYVVDICKYWRELEQLTPIRQNFLLNRTEGTASPQNRAVLIDWLYQVHDRFKLLSDTFHMTIQLIDRYLQLIDVSKHELQLIGSTGTNWSL
ncbi:unnamed protein product [Rotaria sp. Silwood2]|nr:unnamed protein product [Rotaria sp. Silwood2]CAF3851363.1 unnamed protein product [Rotaria sp. Silwood2]